MTEEEVQKAWKDDTWLVWAEPAMYGETHGAGNPAPAQKLVQVQQMIEDGICMVTHQTYCVLVSSAELLRIATPQDFLTLDEGP